MGPQRMFGMTPWVRRLIVANLVVFLLQVTLFVSPGFLATLGFAPLYAFRQPWTFLTYMFVHANLLHLAFNLLALYAFGPEVEERMGGGAFLRYYVLCGLGGAALSLVLGWSFGRLNPVVGASAAVYGVLLAFAWAAPDHPIYVFLLPAPIAAKWLVTFIVAISLVLALLPTSDGVAHPAHLGGFPAGPVPKLGPAASCSSISCRSSWRSSPRPTPPRPITSISSVTSRCCRATGTTTCWTRRRRTRNRWWRPRCGPSARISSGCSRT